MTISDKAGFGYENHILTATLTTDSEEVAFPVTNMADRLTYRVWRTSATSAYIRAEWAVAVPLQAFCIAFPPVRDPSSSISASIGATDVIDIKVSDVAPGGSELLNLSEQCNVNKVRGYYAKVADDEVTGRYLEISINAASRAAEGFFEGAFLYAGTFFQPNVNFTQGSDVSFEEQSLASISPFSGSTYVQSRARLLAFAGYWDHVSSVESDTWLDMQEKVGTTSPVFFTTKATGAQTRKAFIARFESPLQMSYGGAGRVRTRVNLLENR